MSGRRLKDQDRIRKVVLLTQGPNIGKPRSCGVVPVIIEESVAPVLVKNMIRTKSSNHTQVTKNFQVKDASCRQAPSKEHDHTFRSCLMESLKALDVDLVIVVNSRHLQVGEDKSREP